MTEKLDTQNWALLQKLTEAYGLAFFVYAPASQKFCYINPSLHQVLGVNADVVSKNPDLLKEIIFPDDTAFVQTSFEAILQGKEQKKVEFRIMHPEKGIRWICLACRNETVADDNYLVGYAEDFTQEREYLYNLIKFNTKKNSTLEILSHDLAAPFANIQGLSEMLEKQTHNNEKAKQILAMIKADAQRGSDLIRDFVNNEFLESSQVVLHKDRIDIVHRIEVMIENYRQGEELIEKQFNLVVKEKPIFVYVDEMKFMQVLNNLISNSIKFTHDNGSITLTVENQNGSSLISVADNGIGIPAELQPFVFDKFTKARRPGIRGEKSVGMGMSIIRNIVELHGGRIWFSSEEGKGSTFTLEIPND